LDAVWDAIVATRDAPAVDFVKKFRESEEQTPAAPSAAGLLAQGWPAVLQRYWELASNFPRFTESVPLDVVQLAKQRESLPEDLAVVQYAILDTAVYAFVFEKNDAYCRQINISRAAVLEAMRLLASSLAATEKRVADGVPVAPVKTWQEPHVRAIMEALERLGDIFVAPIRGELRSVKTLAFAPSRDLAGAPFPAFILREPSTQKFVVQDFAVCYITPMMLSDLMGPAKPVGNGSGKAVVFADPNKDLPGAVEEAEAIRDVYTPTEVFVGDLATREQFKKSAATAVVLHIAAHHKLESAPGRFRIQLAASPAEDGSIGVDDLCDINNHRLALVVLSACETAASKNPGLASAAEVLSLTGAPSVVGAFWKVSDIGSKELMRRMYSELGAGVPKAEALRRAQVAMIASGRFAHPYYWAGFALYGNPR